jgi:hypothetical protein
LETLRAVLVVFMVAYNQFGKAKMLSSARKPIKEFPFSFLDFL